MAIDIQSENCLTLAQAAKRLPRVRGRKPPHPMTLYRWATCGLKAASGNRVILETAFVGGTRVTSMEALERFFAKKNDRKHCDLDPDQLRAEQALTTESDEAKNRLRALGMLD